MLLSTPRLLLRPWRFSDQADLVTFADNPKVAAFLRDAFPHPYTSDHALHFLERNSKNDPSSLLLALEYQGRACGGIGLFPQDDIHRKNAELGYWLGEPFWGQGLMLEAIQAILPEGFRRFDITRIFAIPFSANLPSQRLLEKAGFHKEATLYRSIFKNGVFYDEIIYSLHRERPTHPPFA